jgi:hypothetical protein
MWEGFDEFRTALRNLPADLTGEAGHIVEATANGAAVDIKRGYAAHRRSGNLQSGVTVTHVDKGKFSAGAIVKNTAKHANIFEVGTQARHTAIGANRGSMPPGHVFVPVVVRARRRMFAQLKDMLVRHGLVVSGDV